MSLPTSTRPARAVPGPPSATAPGSPSPARATAVRIARGAATGLVLGAAVGAMARLWMRAVSTDPGFTWSGTLAILAVFAFAGLLTGVVRTLRCDGRRPAWRVLLAPGLVLFAGPGMLLLPGAVVGGWAFSGRGPRVLRLLALAVAVVGMPLTFWFVVASPHERLVLEPVVVVTGLGALHAALGWGAAELFRRRPSRAPREVGSQEVRAGAATPATR